MKPFLLAFLPLFGAGQMAYAKNDTPRTRRAFTARAKTLLAATKPTISQFHAMVNHEKSLQRQLADKTISAQQYKERATRPADWLTIIPQVRVASRRFLVLKPVPLSMRAAQLNFVRFAECTDQGLNNLKSWIYKRQELDIATAIDDFDSAFLFLDRATNLSS